MTTFYDEAKTREQRRRRMRRIRQAGFSLLEMMISVAILTVVMAVVFNQINLVQKRSRVEDTKLDITQESREFMDQVVRDMHSVGFPTKTMYPSATITDVNVAAGLVKIAYDELWFEGDVDGDGQVDVIDYKLQTGTGGKCPCTISRSQYPKQAGTALLSQTNNAYSVILTGVINSGAGGSGTSTGTPLYAISGNTTFGAANDTVYSTYKGANLFTYYNALGGEITPTDIGSTSNLNTLVKTIQINVNVLGTQGDLRTGIAPVMSYSAGVRMPNQ